ncbi:hypothetical protein U9M48_028051, partial [Paspalum notatum var. saurae]
NEWHNLLILYITGSTKSSIFSVDGRRYTNDDCICIFIKNFSTGFCIILVCVDDLNITGNKTNINEAHRHLKAEFETKDLG